MRALTVHDPWTTAIARGVKPIENRKRPPPSTVTVPFEMAVHASVKPPSDRLMRQVMALWPGLAWNATFYPGHVIAVVDVVGWYWLRDRKTGNPWEMGPACWELANVRTLAEPVPCRGQQGLWTLPADVEAAVRRQLGAV